MTISRSPNLNWVTLADQTPNSSDGVRIIIWGMPDGPPDESKNYIGGCLMDDQTPYYKCITCGWEGFRRTREASKGLYLHE